MAAAGPVRAFLSYAHEDHAWRDRVLKQLGWLVNSGQLQAFDDRQIKPGRAMGRHGSEPSSRRPRSSSSSSPGISSARATAPSRSSCARWSGSAAAPPTSIAIYCDWVDLGALPLAAHQVPAAGRERTT